MPVREIQEIGSSDGSTTYGVSLDRDDLEIDFVFNELENGQEVWASIKRQDSGRFKIVILGVQEPPATTVD